MSNIAGAITCRKCHDSLAFSDRSQIPAVASEHSGTCEPRAVGWDADWDETFLRLLLTAHQGPGPEARNTH